MTGPVVRSVEDRVEALERRLDTEVVRSAYARCYAAAAALIALVALVPLSEESSLPTLFSLAKRSSVLGGLATLAMVLSMALLAVLVIAIVAGSGAPVVGWLVAGLAAGSGAVYLIILDELKQDTTLGTGLGTIQFVIAGLGAIHALHLRSLASR